MNENKLHALSDEGMRKTLCRMPVEDARRTVVATAAGLAHLDGDTDACATCRGATLTLLALGEVRA